MQGPGSHRGLGPGVTVHDGLLTRGEPWAACAGLQSTSHRAPHGPRPARQGGHQLEEMPTTCRAVRRRVDSDSEQRVYLHSAERGQGGGCSSAHHMRSPPRTQPSRGRWYSVRTRAVPARRSAAVAGVRERPPPLYTPRGGHKIVTETYMTEAHNGPTVWTLYIHMHIHVYKGGGFSAIARVMEAIYIYIHIY